jgi:DDE superfamily endonuclease
MPPAVSVPVPATWQNLLEECAPVFARRSTHRLFVALACGLILADRATVTGMAAAAGLAGQWRRACWFFAGANWDLDKLGLAVARLIVTYLVPEGEPVTAAFDGTFFRRWGRKVFAARWAYDGAAQGGKKVGFGNTWVICALVVQLPLCCSPVALPVLFRLWRGKGTASQVQLAGQMLTLLAAAFPGRVVHGTGDAAFHGKPLAAEGTTWTTRLPCKAVLSGLAPPRTGKRGRPREKGDRLGTCAEIAAAADWQEQVIHAYGHDTTVQLASAPALWHGSFGTAPGQYVLVREPGSGKPYDLGLFTLDTQASPASAVQRYSWRWAIEPSNATGKQLTGAGDACNRVQKAVERTVPFAFLIQSLLIAWYARSATSPADVARRRRACPWYRTKTTPAPADMLAALRRDLIEARISAVSPGQDQPRQIDPDAWTCDLTAA